MKPLHEMTRRDFIALPRVKGACAVCRAPHPDGSSNNRKYCDAHALLAQRQCARETTAERQRITRGWRDVGDRPLRLDAAGLARVLADSTLDKGGVRRYCACGRLYQLATFATPSPCCGDALVPQPVTFDPETDL